MTEKINRDEADKYFIEFEKFEDITEEYSKRIIKETMFCNFYD